MDTITVSRQLLSFAKVCVEMDVNAEIPRFVDVVMRNGSKVTVFLEIPWLPSRHSTKYRLIRYVSTYM
ncbi:hypothetical protein REPUB_Repub16aG0095300 [Reevesia pubescens]